MLHPTLTEVLARDRARRLQELAAARAARRGAGAHRPARLRARAGLLLVRAGHRLAAGGRRRPPHDVEVDVPARPSQQPDVTLAPTRRPAGEPAAPASGRPARERSAPAATST